MQQNLVIKVYNVKGKILNSTSQLQKWLPCPRLSSYWFPGCSVFLKSMVWNLGVLSQSGDALDLSKLYFRMRAGCGPRILRCWFFRLQTCGFCREKTWPHGSGVVCGPPSWCPVPGSQTVCITQEAYFSVCPTD